MLLASLLFLYGVWFCIKAIRDPAGAFPWLIPLVAVTRSPKLLGIGERLILFDFLLVVWLGLVLFIYLPGRDSVSLPRDGILALSSYGLFLGICALSLIDAQNLGGGITVLAKFSFGPCIALAALIATQMAGSSRAILTSLVITFCLVTLLGVLEAMGLPSIVEPRHAYRLTTTFRSPNQLGSFLFILLPIAAGFLLSTQWRRTRLKIITAVALAIAPFVLLLTSSRTSLAVVVIEMVLFALLSPFWIQSLGRKWSRLIPIVGSSLILIPIGLYSLRESRHFTLFRSRVFDWARYLAGAPDLSSLVDRLTGRASGQPFVLNTILSPLRAVQAHPWLGIGIGNAGTVLEILPGRSSEIHNQYLAIVGECGILGTLALLLFLSLMVVKVYEFVRNEPSDRWMAIGIALAFGACLISGVYIRFLRRRASWILLGIILAGLPIRRRPDQGIVRA